ncbi:MAG: extracellular solute-binding protein [Rhodocyclaceae bacterium]
MNHYNPNRRQFNLALAALAGSAFLPGTARAASSMVAAVFPGSWEDAYRRTLVPILAKNGIELVIAPMLAQDQLAKTIAAAGKPAYDALLMSPGQTAEAVERGLIEKIDTSKIPNWSKLDDKLKSPWGPTVTVEVNGIAYNPEMVPRPKGYKDLFTNPAYDGKVAWLGFGSNSATMAWVEIARLFGGGEDNMQPVFELLRKHLPKIGAIANSGNAQMALFQQREIGVFMASTNNVSRLKSMGVPCEFVHPESGSPAIPVNIHLTKGAANPAAVYAYMDAAISAAAQNQLKMPPVEQIPTNKDVAFTPSLEAFVTRAQMAKFIYQDWAKINKNRAAWTAEFDRIVKK